MTDPSTETPPTSGSPLPHGEDPHEPTPEALSWPWWLAALAIATTTLLLALWLETLTP